MKNNSLQTTTFGDYTLLKKLCCGSVAEIFLACRATEQKSRKNYVIKKFLNHISTKSNKLQGFIKEGEIATSLSHQNIVYCHEFGSVDSADQPSYYLAMDYVFGKNLAQINRQQPDVPLPVNITISIIKSVAGGLDYAHTFCDPFTLEEQHITHKDISPDNILVSYSGETKIIDFGISEKGEQIQKSDKISGKIKYMSPEQLLNKELDHRSDIYSLGVVFWECLTGTRLFPERSEPITAKSDTVTEVAHPCTVNVDIPQEVGDICIKCLEVEPEDRFQSCRELYDALLKHSHAERKERKDLQVYMLDIFSEEFKTEALELLEVREGKYPQQHEHTNPVNEDMALETTAHTVTEVHAKSPLAALSNSSLVLDVDPECRTITGTITDGDLLFPIQKQLSAERTMTSYSPAIIDEPTIECEPKRFYN